MNLQDVVMAVCAVVSILVAGVAAMVETALLALTPARADQLLAEGRRGAEAVKQITDDPAPATTTATFLRVFCEVMSVVLVCLVLVDRFSTLGMRLWLSVLAMTLVSFVVWGVAPRTIGGQKAESVACASARSVTVLSVILWPISQLLIVIGNAITPGRGYLDGPFAAEVERIAGASDGEREMIKSVFELGDTLVREVMVPRTDVVYLNQDKTLRQGFSLALRSGFSRIPVIADNLDQVVGVLYVKDLMRRVFEDSRSQNKETVGSLMRVPSFTPDSKPIDDLLQEMQTSRHHMVIVIDEFGGTAGIATIEDIVEEIVGEITDEYDAEPDLAEEIEPGAWRVSARMPVDDMGELFSLEVDDEDVETVGGLLAKELNMVPIVGSQVVWNGLEITAEKSKGRRHQINTVVVRQVNTSDQDESGEQDHD